MKQILTLLPLLLLPLAACQDLVEGTQDVSNTVKYDAVTTAASIREIFSYRRKDSYAAVPYTFCYQVMQDIICYDRPIKGAERRLVNWQGRPGPNGEIVVNSPIPGGTEPVELARIPVEEAKKKGALTPLTPVFIESAPPVKEDGIIVKANDTPGSALY